MFYPISGDWVESGILNLAGMFLMKSYLMLENNRFTAFKVNVKFKVNSLFPLPYSCKFFE